MKIGIDIDGVLTNIEQFSTDYLSKYCVENNIPYHITDCDYHLFKTFNITEEQEDNFWLEYLKHYVTCEKARPFASEVIQKLKKEGHEIYIITARDLTNQNNGIGQEMRELVKNWLHDNQIFYDKLIFAKYSQERKVREIKEHQIDLMIEDSPKNINELSKIISVICYNTQYNQNCQGNNIIRCYSWYDIYQKIKDLNA